MRTPEEFVSYIASIVSDEPIKEQSDGDWPELSELSFRQGIEFKCYEAGVINNVYFMAPKNDKGWVVVIIPQAAVDKHHS